jgi:hypothetical protein
VSGAESGNQRSTIVGRWFEQVWMIFFAPAQLMGRILTQFQVAYILPVTQLPVPEYKISANESGVVAPT